MNKKIRLWGLSGMLVLGVACSHKKEKALANESDKIKDSTAVKEEAKKAITMEKHRLPKPYHPEENAEAKISELVKQAQKQHKNIILQAGGNWCIWCLRFNNYVQNTPELKKIVEDNYLYYHLNFSPENKNQKVFAQYGNPGDKYGYPVFIILDDHGKQIHIQDSGALEEGKGYSLEKVKKFLEDWIPKA
ncbi:thioredoxin family protein [Elizabethkingia argentiflava]|uniref:Thioredoxin family protein n=1 Tax=Elizabethkingia argenteiflava TaxID=2681556 RepID=A0A845PXG9_9FLAO|nr:thioredoxin family protein [Elizabethkingia argenteiflava]NAW51546.1 thioredoxin family protein [Elizabethkingia argenteiflava]